MNAFSMYPWNGIIKQSAYPRQRKDTMNKNENKDDKPESRQQIKSFKLGASSPVEDY